MMMTPEQSKVHYNRPQLRSMAIMAQHEVAIWARGTGKSDGLIAPRTRHNVIAMPRSLGVFVARSFQQLLTRTLPPWVRGMERLGLRMGKHYVVRERNKKWPLPLMPPIDWHNAIHFANGTAIALASQQNAGSTNGLSIDWLVGDEAKYLKKLQYEDETLPAMRANRDVFGDLSRNPQSAHHSTLLATDMPTTPASRWLLDAELKVDEESVRYILDTQVEVSKLEQALASGRISGASAKVYYSRINQLQRRLNHARTGTTYFSMASAIDNLEVLGESYLARMRQNLPDHVFRTAVLNIRPDRVEGGFYPSIDEVETYVVDESSWVSAAGNDMDKLEVQDCRRDDMLVPTLPLWLGPDFGSSFNCLVIGQVFGEWLNIDNQLYVKHPKKIKDLARAFHVYYQYHGTRHLKLLYDHTMIGEDAQRDYGFAEELRRELTALGWEVEMIYVGQAPGHHVKYTFWVRAIARSDYRQLGVRFNEENCEPTLLSMRLAGAKQTRRGFEKDKSSERNPNSDQAETTHLSDACDLLAMGSMQHLGNEVAGGVDIVFG